MAAITLLVIAACSPASTVADRGEREAEGANGSPARETGGVGGSHARWSEEVASAVPLHVKGKVLSRGTIRPADDPSFPKDDPSLQWILDSDRVDGWWEVEVIEWPKGTSRDRIRIHGRAVGEGDLGDNDFIAEGGTYFFYLDLEPVREGFDLAEEADEAARNLDAHPPFRHWILVHAELDGQATFPGAGANQ